MDLNTCFETAHPYYAIAYYSHLLPAAIAVFLGWFTAATTKRSKRSIAFLFFTLAVALWLLNDIILWTTQNYYFIAFFWSWIDFVNAIFFVLAAYFFGVLARDSISGKEKLFLLALCIPSFLFTVTGNAVTSFNHAWCEMFNNDRAVLYKSFVEWASIAFMLVSFVIARKVSDKDRRRALWVVLIALILFLATFSVTEYLAAQTAVYEINLYGLFALPIFLVAMVFAITNLEVFRIRYLGAQLLIYILIMLVASQFLFLESSTDALLNGLTLALSCVIGLILLQNEKQALHSLVKIEKLAAELSDANTRLQDLDRMKSQFLSFASHQLKSPLTAIKWQAEMIMDGSLGAVPAEATAAAREIEESVNGLSGLVNEFLDLRKIEEGRMEYKFEVTDIPALVGGIVHTLIPVAQHKNLELTFADPATRRKASVDAQNFTQIVQNLIDNALKYTEKGSIAVSVADGENNGILITVKDTGHGMSQELIDHAFEQFVRAPGTAKLIEGTGLGLYIAREIMKAHKGRIWATSDGPGKGSTFWVWIASA